MCWNAEVSLNTFLFGMISMTIVLLNKISFITILLALTLSLIQLMEYYAWNNINNKDAIFKLSIIGYFIIVSQILILNYGFLNNDRLISVILVLSIYFFIYNYQNDKFYMEKGSMWCYMSNFFWILLILKSLILTKKIKFKQK